MQHIDRLLELAIKKRAGELRLQAGQPPQLYVAGNFEAVGASSLTSELVQGYIRSILPDQAQQDLVKSGAATADFDFGGAVWFHVRAVRDASGVTLVIRAYLP